MFKKIIRKIYRNKVNITVKEMLEIIKTNNNVTLLDVRSNQEYKEGHLARSVNIPVFDLNKNVTRIINKDNIVIVYCSAGIRSKRAMEILKKQGYKNLYNIEGGIQNL